MNKSGTNVQPDNDQKCSLENLMPMYPDKRRVSTRRASYLEIPGASTFVRYRIAIAMIATFANDFSGGSRRHGKSDRRYRCGRIRRWEAYIATFRARYTRVERQHHSHSRYQSIEAMFDLQFNLKTILHN
jgi:hypothetical protein